MQHTCSHRQWLEHWEGNKRSCEAMLTIFFFFYPCPLNMEAEEFLKRHAFPSFTQPSDTPVYNPLRSRCPPALFSWEMCRSPSHHSTEPDLSLGELLHLCHSISDVAHRGALRAVTHTHTQFITIIQVVRTFIWASSSSFFFPHLLLAVRGASISVQDLLNWGLIRCHWGYMISKSHCQTNTSISPQCDAIFIVIFRKCSQRLRNHVWASTKYAQTLPLSEFYL